MLLTVGNVMCLVHISRTTRACVICTCTNGVIQMHMQPVPYMSDHSKIAILQVRILLYVHTFAFGTLGYGGLRILIPPTLTEAENSILGEVALKAAALEADSSFAPPPRFDNPRRYLKAPHITRR